MRNYKKARMAVKYIQHFIGLPYRWGGDDPIEGFDCSGLAIEMLKSVGWLDHEFDTTANRLANLYANELTKEAKPGCLVFYGKNAINITHVGIAITNDLMIEAGGGNSNTLSADRAADQNAYIRMRRIDSRSDMVCICDPFDLKR